MIEESILTRMKELGGTWACYENQVMDSAAVGNFQFLKYGPGCTFKEPPLQAPDSAAGLGWKYRFVGTVNLETGEIDRCITSSISA